jgi:menaquinone-specific isochorismate synthase
MVAGDRFTPYAQVVAELRDRIRHGHGNIRYIGGFRFDERGEHAPAWSAFKSHRFILPRFEALRDHGGTVFACNMRTDEDRDEVLDEFNRLSFGPPLGEAGLPLPTGRTDHPPPPAWARMVRAVLSGIAEARYQKVVLAREVVLEFDTPVNPPCLLRALKAHTHSSFHFCFQPNPDSAFVGASPERLYRRDHDRLKTEAIAGTRPRGETAKQDDRQRRELLGSAKDRLEHQFVVDAIRDSLAPLTVALNAEPAPGILGLAHAQHLVTRFEGELAAGVSDGELLEALHPTPAVGGQPRDRALDEIARLEPFDRGWFAGPVGWIGRDNAQFVVGIRSALVDGLRLHLYSGAGIVADSDPAEEWDEIENKIRDYLEELAAYEPKHS